MSGHSHFKSIKYQKAITDAKKGRLFSKLSGEISVSARKGGDPNFNPGLRLSIEKAKSVGMPNESIDRAIQKGTGELSGEKLEEVIFEAYGPGGTAIIIEGITDNKNRTLGEIKQVLNQNSGKLASEGSVKWLFGRKGCIVVDYSLQTESLLKDKENLEMIAIELGADDFSWKNNILDIYTKIEDLEKIKKGFENQGIKVESASLDWVAKELIRAGEKDRESCQKLFEALDENDAVQEIFSNLMY